LNIEIANYPSTEFNDFSISHTPEKVQRKQLKAMIFTTAFDSILNC